VNHQAEAHIEGSAKTDGRLGLHMNASVNIVVPLTEGFGPPRELKVDHTKVTVHPRG
jgi:hypothetical protein